MKPTPWRSTSTKGAALVEYGILVGLIAVTAIGAVITLGAGVRDTFDTVTSTVASSLEGAPAEVAGNIPQPPAAGCVSSTQSIDSSNRTSRNATTILFAWR